MTSRHIHITVAFPEKHLVLDLSDVYTWSFPEFIPFCRHLYDFSSFKAFTRISQA